MRLVRGDAHLCLGIGLTHLAAHVCLVLTEAALRLMPLQAHAGPMEFDPYVMRGCQEAAMLVEMAVLQLAVFVSVMAYETQRQRQMLEASLTLALAGGHQQAKALRRVALIRRQAHQC